MIKPFIDESVENNYCHSEDEIRVARPEFVTLLNEQVIKHAETILISNQISENLLEEIRKFKNWKYDCLINKIPHDKGELVISTLKVTEAIDTD